MVDGGGDVEPFADMRVVGRQNLAVALDHHRRRLAVVVAVEHAHADGLRLADDAVAGRLDQLQPPVALALVAGDERVQGRVKAEGGGVGGDVVDDAVSDEDRAADALGRRVGQRVAQRGEQFGALVVGVLARAVDEMRLDVVHRGELLGDRRARGVCLGSTFADAVGAGAVDDHGDHVFQRAPILALQRGVGEREQQQRGDQRAAERGARPSPGGQRHREHSGHTQRDIEPQREGRRKVECPVVHRDSLSRRSRACT